MEQGFSCVSLAGRSYWSVAFGTPSLWRGIASRGELESFFGEHDWLLLIGLFEWSNASWQVFGEASRLAEPLREQGIGLAACCLENPEQLREIDIDCFREYMTSGVEPIVFVLSSGRLLHIFRGPLSIREFSGWMSSGGSGVGGVSDREK